MNAAQYYIIDSFIKDGSAGHEAVPTEEEDDDISERSSDDLPPHAESHDPEQVKATEASVTEQAVHHRSGISPNQRHPSPKADHLD